MEAIVESPHLGETGSLLCNPADVHIWYVQKESNERQ